MGQETRKDPRAKVLTMTVRYKSATLDEFIEHHSYDVSRGGMFIKTPSPFPPGTLLKFEVRIAEDQKVIQGVGRVVWKREAETGDRERPSGMGVKFIKIDDPSRKIIDQLVDARADAGSAYEAGGGDGGSAKTVPSATPPGVMTPAAAEATSGKPGAVRKATMIGLGAMGAQAAAAAAAKAAESAPPPPVATGVGFFPHSDSEADMPAPEDRTVMKQAAELLQDALREAGGSMDEVGSKPDARKSASTELPPTSESKPRREADQERAPEKQHGGPSTLRSEPPKSEKTSDKKPSSSARPSAAAVASERARSERPPSVRSSARPPVLSEAPPVAEGGGGRIMIILAGIAVAAAAVFFLTKKEPPPPAPEPPAAEVKAPEPTPPPVIEPAPVEPVPAASASAATTPSAALAASAAPAAGAPTAALPPAPVAKPKPAPAPFVAAPKPKPKPTPTPVEPVAETPPAEPKPAADPKPAAPAPKPKPVDPAGDNPY